MEMTDFDDTMKERFDLAEDKVRQIAEEETRPYFRRVGEILENIFALSYDKTMDTRGLYADALPEAYPMSFLNPAYAVKTLGVDLGRALSLLYRDILALIPMVLEGKTARLTESLTHRMESAAEELRFEEAARLRDRIRAVRDELAFADERCGGCRGHRRATGEARRRRRR